MAAFVVRWIETATIMVLPVLKFKARRSCSAITKSCQARFRRATLQFMKRFSLVVALLMAVSGVRAEGPDDQYVRIYNLIQEGDRLSSAGQPGDALPKYLEAQAGLERFQKGFPDWNTGMVTFRLNYVAGKIAALSQQAPVPESAGKQPVTPPGTKPPPAKAAPSDWEARLATMAEQARQLQADKAVLEAKLKEALSVQPAAMDPRELARAEEKIKALQKDNDLLKASLDEQKAKHAPAPDTKALDEARQALETANGKLAEQSKLANDLAQEKAALQEKLNALARNSASAAELETTKKALQQATAKLTEEEKKALIDAVRQAKAINATGAPESNLLPNEKSMNFSGSLTFGIFLVLVGVFFLLDRYFRIDLSFLFDFWPVLLIAFGAWQIFAYWKSKQPAEPKEPKLEG